ncbi:MAG: hypothetical protein IJG47_15545 [Microbacterium sp.]|nr:hypothetical protein [Microbacterium sp.]
MDIMKKMIAIAGVALVVGLAGCTADAANEEEGSGSQTAAETKSPLEEYLASVYDSSLSEEAQEKERKALDAKFGEVLVKCMKEQGFEYYTVETEDIAEAEIDWRPDDRDWVEKYGYGTFENPAFGEAEVEQTEPDPNFAYRDSLPESARAAYDLAYSGPDNPVDENGQPLVDYDWKQEGCNGLANHEVFDAGEPDPYADLQARIDEVQRGWDMDRPEMAELNGEWSACMSEAGESGFGMPFDARASISEADPLNIKPAPGEDPDDVESPSEDSPEMKALREREIELALIDLDCREKTEYAKKSQELQYAAERQFIEDNKAELDEFKLAAEQADG